MSNSITPCQKERILQLAAEGKEQREIASKVGVVQSTVAKFLSKQGEYAQKKIHDGKPFVPDPPKAPMERPDPVYSNNRQFEYYLPVRERRVIQ